MSDHVCGAFDQVKAAGCCTCCREEIYEVYDRWTDGPLAGHPRRLGPMLEHGTQVEVLLSDGSTADIAMCLPCAQALVPEAYSALWRACVRRQNLSLQLAGRSANERKVAHAHLARLWPLALLRRRREVGDGVLGMDRRLG